MGIRVDERWMYRSERLGFPHGPLFELLLYAHMNRILKPEWIGAALLDQVTMRITINAAEDGTWEIFDIDCVTKTDRATDILGFSYVYRYVTTYDIERHGIFEIKTNSYFKEMTYKHWCDSWEDLVTESVVTDVPVRVVPTIVHADEIF